MGRHHRTILSLSCELCDPVPTCTHRRATNERHACTAAELCRPLRQRQYAVHRGRRPCAGGTVVSCRRRRAERVHAARRGLLLEQHFSKGGTVMGRTSSAHHVHAWLHACVPAGVALMAGVRSIFISVLLEYRLASSYCDSSRIYSQLATIAVAP
jgi:hypothetical protein